MDRDELIAPLVEIQYERNDIDFDRGTFRVRGRRAGDLPGCGSSPRRCGWSSSATRSTASARFDPVTGVVLGQP